MFFVACLWVPVGPPAVHESFGAPQKHVESFYDRITDSSLPTFSRDMNSYVTNDMQGEKHFSAGSSDKFFEVFAELS